MCHYLCTPYTTPQGGQLCLVRGIQLFSGGEYPPTGWLHKPLICWYCYFWQARSIHRPTAVQTKIFLNHSDIYYLLILGYDFYSYILSCCFSMYKFILLSYLLVKILYTSIISPIRLYLRVGNFNLLSLSLHTNKQAWKQTPPPSDSDAILYVIKCFIVNI